MTQPTNHDLNSNDGRSAATVGFYAVWIPRLIALTIVVLATWTGSVWFFGQTATFWLFALGVLFLSFALLPGVRALVRRGWKRGSAAGFVTVAGVIVVGVLVFAIGSLMFTQVSALIEKVPGWAIEAADWLESNGVTIDPDEISLDTEELKEFVGEYADDLVGAAFGAVGGLVGVVLWVATGAFFIYYLLKDEPRMVSGMLSGFPPNSQEMITQLWEIAIDKTGGYVYSRGVLAAFSAVYHGVIFWVLELPGPMALGIFVGIVSQFIPNIGTYIAGFVPAVVGLLEGGPTTALWVVLAVVAYQQIENLLLQPRVTAETMDLHPALAFGAAIVGGMLLGAFGALIALPIAAIIQAFVGTFSQRYEVIHPDLLAAVEEERARPPSRSREGGLMGRSRRDSSDISSEEVEPTAG